MRALCIDCFGVDLTHNKWYDVLDIIVNDFARNGADHYIVLNDQGNRANYSSQRFKTMDMIREEKLNKLL